ncbi:GNAT family N-acetyltransferase [Mesosutterella sp. OilRF-GAM-744-9]|uniref:GNAT family N-acetyltransferase n=1 Tax=Mesosutterella porci TaxID=2915351 RepID=A0ABS9MSB6_9BURK|nr:GNAT family N-acetyltransferase [Mesosutterella sp. oilRF-744-WT-GAM-9]MCG5031521.1 GNAT family N-acetyltransferase [Mesosutterella sp. oilRF-744-WT-GAM-9]
MGGNSAETAVTFRQAQRKDVGVILQMIRALAAYERLQDQVTATEAVLEEWLFDKKKARVLFAMAEGREAGFAVYFYNFSTFLGRAGIHLEDLFVLPEFRGRGIGHAILKRLAGIAQEEGCGRLEWTCLDWNEPSIRFYLSRGARPMSDWTNYRVEGAALRKLAQE